ncbi:MAG: hypothetical protein ABEJ35_01845 [Halobacteriaceae archaeon]
MTSRRTVAAVAVVGLLIAGIAPFVAVAQTTTGTQTDDGDTVAPGQRLGAVVSSQGTDLKSDLATRTLRESLRRAESNGSRARILAGTIEDLTARLEELRAAQDRLQARYENGSLSFGQYVARSAQLMARERAFTQLLNVTERQAARLPATVREANGVNMERLATLRERARNITGPAVAELARELAGPPEDVPANQSEQGRSTPAIAQAAAAVRTAERQVLLADRLIDAPDSSARETLARARDRLREAHATLEAARAAAADGEQDRAATLAAEARSLARDAAALAEQARHNADTGAGGGNDEGNTGKDPTTGPPDDTGAEGAGTSA